MPSAAALKSELARLPIEDRTEIAGFLIETLNDDSTTDDEAAFDAELRRRIAEIEAGDAVGIPAEEVFARTYENRNFCRKCQCRDYPAITITSQQRQHDAVE